MIKSIELKGVEFLVEYSVEPGEPEVHTLPNGDPGTPGTPDKITILSVETGEGYDWTDILRGYYDEIIEIINS